MNSRKLLLIAALIPISMAACSEVATPVTGKTQSLSLLAKPSRTDMTPSVVPGAEQAVGGIPTAAAKPDASTADLAKDLSKQDESSRMPMAGHGNNHSLPNPTPAGKQSGS